MRSHSDADFAAHLDEDLVLLATSGDKAALEALLRRHQAWVFNLAMYMLQARADAEDAAQEILIKAATALSSFKGTSAFRTWLHRIAVNHVLDRRRSRPEEIVTGFDCYGKYLAGAKDRDIEIDPTYSGEAALLVEEARTACTLGMLLCLDRAQRMAFFLGEILEVQDVVGAELLGLTRDHFRKRLSRAREQIANFMRDKCGLVDEKNPCRCARKTLAFIEDGVVDPERLQFAGQHVERARASAPERSRRLTILRDRTTDDLRELYPNFAAPDVVMKLRPILEGPEVREVLNLDTCH